MNNLQVLRTKLRILKRDCQLIPPETEAEQKRRDLQEMMLLLQLECEEWRHSINVAFALCRLKIVTETTDNLIIEKYRTVFKWEAFKQRELEELTNREIKGIDHLTKLYNETYNVDQPEQKTS